MDAFLEALAALAETARRIDARTGLGKYLLLAADRAAIRAALLAIGSDDVAGRLTLYKPQTIQTPSSDPPTTPGSVTATLNTNAVTVSWSASTPVSAPLKTYHVLRSTSGAAGTYSEIGTTTLLTFPDTLPASTTAYYKIQAEDNLGHLSTLSAASSSVTTAGSLVADTTAPAAPAAPTLDAGGGASTSYRVSVATVADSTANSATQIIAGMGTYQAKVDGVLAATRRHPKVAASKTALSIAPAGFTAPSGTDSGSALTASNDDEHYGTEDRMWFNGLAVEGDVVCDVTLNSITPNAGAQWCKAGAEWRVDGTPGAQYVNLFVADATGGAKKLMSECRAAAGSAATQVDVGITPALPIRLRITRRHDEFVAEYATNPASPSWVAAATWVLANVSETGYAHAFSNKCGAGYTLNGATAASRVAFRGIGAAGNTLQVRFDAADLASPANVSTGSSLAVVLNAPAGGDGSGGGTGGGGSGSGTGGSSNGVDSRLGVYNIGGSAANFNDPTLVAFAAKCHRIIISYLSNWEQFYGTTMRSVFAAIQAINPSCEPCIYLDSTRTQDNNPRNAALAFGWALKKSNGDIQYWGDQFGTDIVVNYGSAATDSAGRTAGIYDADYRFDAFRKGGALGLADPGRAANDLCVSTYWDDVFTGPWMPGEFGSASAMRAGWIASWDRWRSNCAADGRTGIVSANIGGAMYNWSAEGLAAYAGQIDLGVLEHQNTYARGDDNRSWDVFVPALQQKGLSPIRAGGHALWSHRLRYLDKGDGVAFSADAAGFAREIRFNAAACLVLTNGLYGPRVDENYNWLDQVSLIVWRKFFDVDTTTGVGKAFGVAGKGFTWLGPWVDNPRSSPQQGQTWIREAQNGFVAVRGPFVGSGSFSFAVRVKRVQCDDDPTQDGAIIEAGTPINGSELDGHFFLKWP